MPPIHKGEVQVFYTALSEVRDPRLLSICWSVLNTEERLRHGKFRFRRDRFQYLMTRGMVRWVLSQHLRVPPKDLEFSNNIWGKPEILRPYGNPLRFNATNTRGMVACVVALDHSVGVDVEDTTRLGMIVDIAKRFFSRSEVAELLALPAEVQRERFFDYWTLKEAYIKGRGMGLSLPLHKFSIVHDPMSAPIVVAQPDIDDGKRWQLHLSSPTPQHRLAAAVCVGDGAPLTFSIHAMVPFADELASHPI